MCKCHDCILHTNTHTHTHTHIHTHTHTHIYTHKHACSLSRMTHDSVADRLGVFSDHQPGSPVGQGRPVLGTSG
jgi:hypothetical protein